MSDEIHSDSESEALFQWWEGAPPLDGATVSCAPGEIALVVDEAKLLARLEAGTHALNAKEIPALAPYLGHHLFKKPKPIDVCFVHTGAMPVDIECPFDPDQPDLPGYAATFRLRLTDPERFVAMLYAVEVGEFDDEDADDDDEEPELDLWIGKQLYAAIDEALEEHGDEIRAQSAELLRDVNQRLLPAGVEATELEALELFNPPEES